MTRTAAMRRICTHLASIIFWACAVDHGCAAGREIMLLSSFTHGFSSHGSEFILVDTRNLFPSRTIS